MPDYIIKALRESENSFRSMIEKNADAVMVVQPNGIIRFANPAAEQLLGRGPGELVGEMFGIPLTPDATTEIQVPTEHCEPRMAEMRVVEVVWDGDQAHLASLRDITDHKHANDALRFVAEASRLLADSLDYPKTISSVAALAVAHLADWCTIDLLNDDGVTVRRVGVAHAQPEKGSLVDQLMHSCSAGLPCDALERVLTSGEPQVHARVSESMLPDFAGGPPSIKVFQRLGCRSVMIVPLKARGRTLGAITFVSDCPARRYRSADLALAKDLAQRAALAIDNARVYDEAHVAVRRRDEFLAMLAHELRNPLAAIQSAVDVMRGDAISGPLSGRARGVIERQGQHMARLLDDLLDIARVMRGKIELRRENIDLSHVIQHAVQTIQPLIDESGHELTVSIMSGPVIMNADPTRLEQVLVNLLSNAAKYTPRGGKMSIEASCHESEVVISVSDTGDGIAPENLASVFDLFVQANRTLARSEGGLGIGLTLVRQLVEMHGGRVQAFSEGHSCGSRFVVHLPIMDGASCQAPIPQLGNDPHRCRIVIVEDNADTREMLRCLLAMDGHEVDVAPDGLRGLEIILSVRPNIALVDIGLPGIDGFRVAEQVRAADPNREIRLVAVTGYGQIGDMQQALNAGFDRHLVKPVKHEAIVEVLSELLAAPTPQSSSGVCYDLGERPCAVH